MPFELNIYLAIIILPAGFYILIPPDTDPGTVAWELRQGMAVLESAGYGTYTDRGVHFERANLQSNQDYAFVLNVQSGFEKLSLSLKGQANIELTALFQHALK